MNKKSLPVQGKPYSFTKMCCQHSFIAALPGSLYAIITVIIKSAVASFRQIHFLCFGIKPTVKKTKIQAKRQNIFKNYTFLRIRRSFLKS
jgi:hypothetical protein